MMQGTASPSVVLKFGGTSVKDAAAMRRVAAITERERGRRPVVVTSACSGVTDSLLECARLSGLGSGDEALAIAAGLRERHLGILQDLGHDEDCRTMLCGMLDQIEQLIRGVLLLRELTPRIIDQFAGFGERLSSVLLTHAFRTSGWNAALADSRSFVITDGAFGSARPLMAKIDRNAPAQLLPLLEAYDVVIAQGFIGRTEDGIDTTIGRGGSDHTGALVGAALHAREIQIWTDVSGILTADPRIVPGARVVPEVTFTEARELAYFGAKVIHPDTILPAVERSIPVVIKNSMRPDDEGTRILPDGTPLQPGIHSITVKRGMTSLRLSPKDPREGSAAVEQSIARFQEHGVTLHCALLAESRALAVVGSTEMDDVLMAALETLCSVETEPEMALLCLCGASLRDASGDIASAIEALRTIDVEFLASGTSPHTVLIGVPQSCATEALAAVHERLFGG